MTRKDMIIAFKKLKAVVKIMGFLIYAYKTKFMYVLSKTTSIPDAPSTIEIGTYQIVRVTKYIQGDPF